MAQQYIERDLVKRDLRITHNADDDLLDAYIANALTQVQEFLDVDSLDDVCDELSSDVSSNSGLTLPGPVKTAVLLLVRSMYDASTPDEITKLKAAAESTMFSYRKRLGV